MELLKDQDFQFLRSEKNIYAQIIDDINGVTLVAASSLDKDFAAKGGNKEGAKLVGEVSC